MGIVILKRECLGVLRIFSGGDWIMFFWYRWSVFKVLLGGVCFIFLGSVDGKLSWLEIL